MQEYCFFYLLIFGVLKNKYFSIIQCNMKFLYLFIFLFLLIEVWFLMYESNIYRILYIICNKCDRLGELQKWLNVIVRYVVFP